MKKVAVFGANGRVGSLVVQGLLDRGHQVIAFVHRNNGLIESELLHVIEGDIHDAVAVGRALDGADVVISTLGSWHTPTKDILRSGMASIIPAMKQRNIKRIISLTGAESRIEGDALSLVHRFAHLGAVVIAGKILVDGETHIKQLIKSDLQWTVLRSPIMNEKGGNHYSLSGDRPYPWQTVNRQAVADALVQQLNDTRYLQKAPFITR